MKYYALILTSTLLLGACSKRSGAPDPRLNQWNANPATFRRTPNIDAVRTPTINIDKEKIARKGGKKTILELEKLLRNGDCIKHRMEEVHCSNIPKGLVTGIQSRRWGSYIIDKGTCYRSEEYPDIFLSCPQSPIRKLFQNRRRRQNPECYFVDISQMGKRLPYFDQHTISMQRMRTGCLMSSDIHHESTHAHTRITTTPDSTEVTTIIDEPMIFGSRSVLIALSEELCIDDKHKEKIEEIFASEDYESLADISYTIKECRHTADGFVLNHTEDLTASSVRIGTIHAKDGQSIVQIDFESAEDREAFEEAVKDDFNLERR